MVINLCRNADAVNPLMKAGQTVLDIAGVISNRDAQIVRIADLDKDGTLESDSSTDYVNFIGDLCNASVGNTRIKDFQILGYPVFWFTKLAEKHDSYHWGKDIWMLYSLLLERRDFFSKSNTVIISGKLAHIEPLLNVFFQKANFEKPQVIAVDKNETQFVGSVSFIDSVKFLVRALQLKKSIRGIKGSVQQGEKNVFVLRGTGSGKMNEDIDLGELSKYSQEKISSHAIPYLDSMVINTSNWQNLDIAYINAAPSFSDIRSIARDQRKASNLILQHRNEVCKVGEFEIPFSVFVPELLEGCYPLYYLNIRWLGNYAGSLKSKTHFFYSDEFYISGRVISAGIASAKSGNAIAYGMQHGLLLENHTVYKISGKEIGDGKKDKTDLPIPDHFLVWGDYFKSLFLKSNSLPSSFVIAAGNLKYIKFAGTTSNNQLAGDKRKILWCTTLANHFKAEYEIVEEALKKFGNYQLTFRLHPVGHIKKEEITSWVDKSIMDHARFSTEASVFDDMRQHDIVISTIFSTAFFDALMMGKISCRIVTGITKGDFTGMNIENLRDIRTSDEFFTVLTEGKKPSHTDGRIEVESLCYTKMDLWENIVTHA